MCAFRYVFGMRFKLCPVPIMCFFRFFFVYLKYSRRSGCALCAGCDETAYGFSDRSKLGPLPFVSPHARTHNFAVWPHHRPTAEQRPLLRLLVSSLGTWLPGYWMRKMWTHITQPEIMLDGICGEEIKSCLMKLLFARIGSGLQVGDDHRASSTATMTTTTTDGIRSSFAMGLHTAVSEDDVVQRIK